MQGGTSVSLSSAAHGLSELRRGAARLLFSSTQLNRHSSRSHAVAIFSVAHRPLPASQAAAPATEVATPRTVEQAESPQEPPATPIQTLPAENEAPAPASIADQKWRDWQARRKTAGTAAASGATPQAQQPQEPQPQEPAGSSLPPALGAAVPNPTNAAAESSVLLEDDQSAARAVRVEELKSALESAPSTHVMVRAKLTVCDLAGSERAGRSGVSGATFNEATKINTSLHALGYPSTRQDQNPVTPFACCCDALCLL